MWWDQYEDPAEAAAQAAKEAEASAKHRNFLAQQVALGESWAGASRATPPLTPPPAPVAAERSAAEAKGDQSIAEQALAAAAPKVKAPVTVPARFKPVVKVWE
ncbi:unnamed protein product [Cladocopium goreaui]|uniref:Uncharacterized protein n=1 Tax=Cladocopium goreaui TaxID=2562237 RepID=A0A9P1G1Y4_9DINO|nr:unnamed protein product [Cladocopium goreaui]